MFTNSLKNLTASQFFINFQQKVNMNALEDDKMKKPEVVASGKCIDNSPIKTVINKNNTPPILPNEEVKHNENHVFIPEDSTIKGFVKLPRSLLLDARWQSMRMKYQKVFLTILQHASYSQKTYDIRTNLVTIGPGQLCVSIRQLVELCNEGVKYNDDKVDKNIIERSVSLFTKFGLVRQEVRHGKCVLTITYPEIYEQFKNVSEKACETRPRLDRDINEEREESKEVKETIDSFLLCGGGGRSVFEPEISKQQVQVLNPEKQQKFDAVWKFAIQNRVVGQITHNGKPGISEKDLMQWFKAYEVDDIVEAIKMTAGKNIKTSFGAYITKLLRDKIPKKEIALKEGKAHVLKFIKQHKINSLDVKEDYFTDTLNNNEQYHYFLPVKTLDSILESCLRRFLQKELGEVLQDESYD